MTFDRLVALVLEEVQDPGIKEPRVKELLNEGLQAVASIIPAPLPALETLTTVATQPGVNYVTLPSNYHRDLYLCYNQETDCRVVVRKSIALLAVEYPGLDETGNVSDVAVSAGKLYYQCIPETAQNLTIHYISLPTTLTDPKDVPSCIPEFLQSRLLVSYAAKRLFAGIEDGIEGPKVNTDFHEKEWQQALKDLILWIGPAHRDPELVNDIMFDTFDPDVW